MNGTLRDVQPSSSERTGRWSLAASISSIISAFIASICCVGPLIFALLGIGGAGLLVKFEPYRPYFIVVTFALLGFGFYFAYRRPTLAAAAGTAGGPECACLAPRASRVGKNMLWIATLLVAGFLGFPHISARLSASGSTEASERAPAEKAASTQTVALTVEGMTCASCTVVVRAALMKLDGVKDARVSSSERRALVEYEPAKVTPQRLVDSVNWLGYRASLPSKGS